MKELFDRLASPDTLTQILIIAFAVVAGLVAHQFGRGALSRSTLAGTGGALARVLRGLVVCAVPLTALVVLLVARTLLGTGATEPALIDLALQLGVALLGVRALVYLLALALGPRSWIGKWESRLALLLWLLLAFALLGWFDFIEGSLDAIDLVPGKAKFTIWSLVKGLVVVTLFIVVASLVSRALESRVMKIDGIALSTRIGISKFTQFFLLGLGVLLGINAAGVDLTALTVLTGAMGIGLGFGLQSIASNFVSGFVLLMDKSIKPGDVISFTGVAGTSTENFGWVHELRGRYVVVRDRDGVDTLVPNQQLITNPVINWSYSDPRVRLKLPVRISYHDDPEKALQVLVEAANCNPRVLREPAPVSRLMHFGDSGIDLELRFWISDPQEGVNNVRSDVNRSIWAAFRESGITIPVAQHDVRMVQLRGGGPSSPRLDDAVDITFIRSAGPGGQNVNKVATAAQLRFRVAACTLDEAAKQRLRKLAGRRLTDGDEIIIVARNHRTQEGNKRDALERLDALIEAARRAPVPRRPTKPTRASKEKRLTGKVRSGRTKQLRGRVRGDD